MNLKDLSFTKDWTLFLDRDGVISSRIHDDYIISWEGFRFLEGVMEAMCIFNRVFGRIIVVSNQQGVAKGRMSAESLNLIDVNMKKAVRDAGGRIDASYYSPHLATENHPDRKPGTGMGLKAKADFPEIDFSKSVMVGDTASDMEFGKRLGMITILISDEENQPLSELVDFYFHSLIDFSHHLMTIDQRLMTKD
ncbi:MAG: HAD-IIIA family hydrolase [Bacteroidales bacterium]|nr:HAD-IIIA family hydrolase [Bacteroidales bacterium]